VFPESSGHDAGIFHSFLLVVGSYKEGVCTDISSHYGLLESDFIGTLMARRKCVATECGHVVWPCVLSGMDNFVQTGAGRSVSRFKNLWHFTSRSYMKSMIRS